MTGLITRYGTLGVFALMVPESACIPIPSEITLLFSGFSVREGWMSFTGAILAATAGNVVGSMIAYGLGASQLLERVPVASTLLNPPGPVDDVTVAEPDSAQAIAACMLRAKSPGSSLLARFRLPAAWWRMRRSWWASL